ncbi:MAG: PilZ domain-containing protein [Treponema sp.]|nr:PilZ domain-containing protein [Treponema sp.]
MSILIAIIIISILFIALASVYSVFKHKIQFFITGLDSGFSIADIALLWKVSQICDLDIPNSLFYSIDALSKCMTQITTQASNDGTDKSQKFQTLLSKLYDYRTKIQNESDDKKGMSTTRSLEKGQKLRIILPGKGVFASEIVNNGNQMVINIPKQKDMIIIPGEQWVGKVVSVYLWKTGDARYVFDTTVTEHGLYLGKSALFLKHSANLVRTQKRKSVRVKCQINATLYIVRKGVTDINRIETQNGYRCILEDISESGALIKIGGKGAQNVKLKLQFTMHNHLILMVGIVRTVEYNAEKNQSLLHFECTHIEQQMKNEILSFVYNTLPENEKEVLEALEQTESDIDVNFVSGENSSQNLMSETQVNPDYKDSSVTVSAGDSVPEADPVGEDIPELPVTEPLSPKESINSDDTI